MSAMGYDAYYTALAALQLAGSTDSRKVNEALWQTKLTGVTGEIAFDQVNGDALRDSAFIKSVNPKTGEWEFVAVQKVN
jgi:branched-chain amino acid transport system substrate-binding protein